jgi:hypothetical protein
MINFFYTTLHIFFEVTELIVIPEENIRMMAVQLEVEVVSPLQTQPSFTGGKFVFFASTPKTTLKPH